MKQFLIYLLLFFSLPGVSQQLISNEWQFRTGDNREWKELNYDSSGWTTILSGKIWEIQGFHNYDGFAWYRQKIFIPESLKEIAVKNNGMTLYLGTIDDSDQVFFNGKLISESGKMPPHYESGYDMVRRIHISPDAVRWDKENLVAIRIYDGGGGGGLVSENISLHVGGFESTILFESQFTRGNHLFLGNEKALIKFNINNSTAHTIRTNLRYFVISDFNDTIFRHSESIRLAKRKKTPVSTDLGKLVPGFYKVTVELSNETFNVNNEFHFGVNPENIISPTDRNPDFDNYWMRAKRELAAVDPQYKMNYVDSLSTSKKDVYAVEMRSLGNILVRGWYVKPKAAGKHPVKLHLQGYGSQPNLTIDYKEDGFAHFLLNIRGTGMSKDNIEPGFPGYILHSLADKEQYIYRGAYMDCVRAVDFLYSRDEIDTRYVIAEGNSQGGALAIATAALNNDRIAVCISGVPFLSDFRDFHTIAPWQSELFHNFQLQNPSVSWDRIYDTLSYIDIKNLAERVHCPVLMAIGLKDRSCPPHINFAMYNQLNVLKEYIIYPEAGHGLPSNFVKVKADWIKKQMTN